MTHLNPLNPPVMDSLPPTSDTRRSNDSLLIMGSENEKSSENGFIIAIALAAFFAQIACERAINERVSLK
jgi:hypothetical protein